MPFDGGVGEAALIAGAADAAGTGAAAAGTAAATDAALTAGALGATDVAATGALAGGADLAATGALAGGSTGAGLLGAGAADAVPAALGVTASTPADIGLLATSAAPGIADSTMAAGSGFGLGSDAGAAPGIIAANTAPGTVATDAGGTVLTTGLPQSITDAGGTTMTGGQAGGDLFSKIGSKWAGMTLGQKLQAGGTLMSGLSGAKGLTAGAQTPGPQTTIRQGTPGSPRGGEAIISAIVQQMLQRRNQAMSAQLGMTGQPITYAPSTGLLGF